MKLSLKLPLAFAGSISLLLAGALFGIYQLNRAVTSYEDDVLHHVAANKKAAETIGFFAVAIQEWKNVLLRGKDPKELEKYWDSHSKEMKKVSDGLSALQEMLTAANEKKTLDKLSASLALANEGYKKAFEEFKTSGGDAAIGDKAARGKDREAVALMTELQKQLSKAELDASSASPPPAPKSPRATTTSVPAPKARPAPWNKPPPAWKNSRPPSNKTPTTPDKPTSSP
jgi:hypothetical protein